MGKELFIKVKEKHSKIHFCDRCKGRFLKTRGRDQKICVLCLKETDPEGYIKTFPGKIIPTVLHNTERKPVSASDRTSHLYNKTIKAEETKTTASDVQDSGQDEEVTLNKLFRFARNNGFKDYKRRDEMIKMLKEGKSYKSISVYFGCDHTSIRWWAIKLGLR